MKKGSISLYRGIGLFFKKIILFKNIFATFLPIYRSFSLYIAMKYFCKKCLHFPAEVL